MSNNKQSSVEWYINNLIDILGNEICNKLTIEQINRIHFLGNQAVAMHKKQSFETFKAGQDSMEEGGKGFDQWYQETFGGNNDNP